MPTFEKSSPELVARFEEVVARVATPDTTRRPMFGYPCAWVNGNMATGLFADSWWVRLAPDRLERALASGEARPMEVMPGRGMKGYASMPDAVIRDDAAVLSWVAEALAYTATLPPKEARARKR
jgi:TfoX/Sxy family transcriptional regulator of competence genes